MRSGRNGGELFELKGRCHEDRRRLRHLPPPPATRLDDPLFPSPGLSGRPAGLGHAGRRRAIRQPVGSRAGGSSPRRRGFPRWAKNATPPPRWSATTSRPWPSGTTTTSICPGPCRPRRPPCRAAWSRPSLVLHPQDDGSLRQHATGGLFHGGWAYRRELLPARRRLSGHGQRRRPGPGPAIPPTRRRSGRSVRAGLPAVLRLRLERRRLASVGHGRRRLSAAGRPAGGEDAAANRAARRSSTCDRPARSSRASIPRVF